MTRIGQGIAAGVAQHVSMDPERQFGALANGFHEAVDGVRRERPAALSLEDERTRPYSAAARAACAIHRPG
jgi:hypothetical protein